MRLLRQPQVNRALRSRANAFWLFAGIVIFAGSCASANDLVEQADTAQASSTSSTATVAETSSTSTSAALTSTASSIDETTTSTATTTTSASSTSTASTSTTSTSTTSTSTASTSTTEAPALNSGEVFEAQIFEVAGPIGERLVSSWREGCPVELADLRLIAMNHWNYQGQVVGGELVVHKDHALNIVAVFSRLFDAQFPIERMELVDNYQGDDDLSMAANNTSAFNCREIASRPGSWSNHAFGAAIDINPLSNPFVSSAGVFPPGGSAFTDRSVQTQGGIYAGDVVTQAFASIGWGWGGDWNNSKDWQHFSASGN